MVSLNSLPEKWWLTYKFLPFFVSGCYPSRLNILPLVHLCPSLRFICDLFTYALWQRIWILSKSCRPTWILYKSITSTHCAWCSSCFVPLIFSIHSGPRLYSQVLNMAKIKAIPVRGYISCVLGCPYEGSVSPDTVARVAELLWSRGCYEISLGDTIGRGTPER